MHTNTFECDIYSNYETDDLLIPKKVHIKFVKIERSDVCFELFIFSSKEENVYNRHELCSHKIFRRIILNYSAVYPMMALSLINLNMWIRFNNHNDYNMCLEIFSSITDGFKLFIL